MLWAKEAHPADHPADSKVREKSQKLPSVSQINSAHRQRFPASVSDLSHPGISWSSHQVEFLQFRPSPSYDSLLLGKSLSLSFKEGPFYVPTQWVLIRFK
jgi:hypothetical protein